MSKQRTLVVMKPDAMQRQLAGEILRRYEKAGLKLVAAKVVSVDKKLARRHYQDSMASILGEKSKAAGWKVTNTKKMGFKVLGWLRRFLMSRPLLAVVLEGEDAIKLVRKVTGYTDPVSAKKGTVRGDLGRDSIVKANAEHRPVYNLVHASGNAEEAAREIKLWFRKLK